MKTAVRSSFAALFAVVSAASLPAHSQDFPNKPIRIASVGTTGTQTDLIIRTIATGMSNLLGQQLVIEPESGATGLIAARRVAKSAPDGYTLLWTQSSRTIVTLFMKDPGVNFAKELAPISFVGDSPLYLLTNLRTGFNNINDLVAHAKANPGKLNYGGTSPTDLLLLNMTLIRQKYNIDIVDVYYKDGSTAYSRALRANEVQVILTGLPDVTQAKSGGWMKPLMVTGTQRSPDLPDVPSAAELGMPELGGVEFMLFGVAGTPAPVIEKLNQAVVRSLQDPSTNERIRRFGITVAASSPEAMGQRYADQMKRYAAIVQKAGIKPE